MRLIIDTEAKILQVEESDSSYHVDLYSDRAFELLSHHWLKVGWNQKYPYTFSWMGRPIIQIPEDIIRVQEVIYQVKPDVIIETGVAHGGSLIFYASLCKAMERGRIIGVDIEIRPHNRVAIESHELASMITLIEGSSVDPAIVTHVHSLIAPGETVLVILDSNHTYQHVLAELDAYHNLVTPGSYIVATDGSMGMLYDVPRGQPMWEHDNPAQAAHTFAQRHPNFVIEQPAWPFNESTLNKLITHWPDAWLRRIA